MSSELVGRDAPLGVLRDALAASTKGRGRLILVTGEAGIGKSAICAAIAAEAEANGTAVICHACGGRWIFRYDG